jgi:TRAP-type C4-dicarboxylate transport system permease small subunit
MTEQHSKSTGGSWAAPIARLDERWQKLESRICAVVLIAETVALTAWIILRGVSTDYQPGGNAAGLVCRNIISAAALGTALHFATRRRGGRVHNISATVGVLVGLFFGGRIWAHAGVHWASNMLNWLQNASVLMLIGGLRGLATRLTLWLALLGASLATSRGKHIHVDVFLRFLPEKVRPPAVVAGWFAAAAVCVGAAFGFADYITIAEFRVSATQPCPGDATQSCEASTGYKLSGLAHEVSSDLFLLGRQSALDMKSLPRVVTGTPYDGWMTAAEWNAWLDSSDWTAHFEKNAVDALHMSASEPNATRMPQVAVPGTGEQARGLLIRDFNFVFPLGLAVIAIKFLMRALLVLSGLIEIHPESELEDEELKHAHDRDEAAAREGVT